MEKLCVDNLRILSLCEIEKANSGHPGVVLSAAPIFYSLYANILNYDASDDKNIFRDRFVCSAGHSSSLLYATLHLFGFDINISDLKNFRQLGSKTPGHPEFNKTSGVDCSTGPLGQGVANAVGMAIAGKYYKAKFNKKDIELFNNKVYCFVGDGCLMEGISYEATSIAGNLKLDNLVLIYDCNKRTIDGDIDITWNENIKKRFEAINFDYYEVKDGNSVDEITENLLKAKNSKKPCIVVVNTILGYGSEFADNSIIHGKPLNLDQIDKVKQHLGIKVKNFEILDEVKQYVSQIKVQIKKRFDNQRELLKYYQKKYHNDYLKLISYLNFEYNEKAVQDVINCDIDLLKPIRDINQEIFNCFSVENMLGGSADVENSTKMFNLSDEEFSSKNYAGKKLHYGVREHAMAGITNGICLFGGLECYACCFLSFMDYLKPALRMTLQMELPVLYVFTHDSVMIGEDGPTHQAIEQLISLRAIPKSCVFRAYNDDEIKSAYIHFLTTRKPTILVLSRAKYNFMKTSIEDAKKGAYIVEDYQKVKGEKITILASGSDVETALNVRKILITYNINCKVVSIPSTDIFDNQEKDYKDKILLNDKKIFTIECGSELGLIKYVKNGIAIGLNNFGESGKPEQLVNYFEMMPNQVAEKIKKALIY